MNEGSAERALGDTDTDVVDLRTALALEEI